MEADYVSLEGTLVKQGHVIKNWKKRLFVLEKNELRYYKLFSSGRKERGVLVLDNAMVVSDPPPTAFRRAPPLAVGRRRRVTKALPYFQIVSDGKTLNIRCSSSEEKDQWIAAIRKNILVTQVVSQQAHGGDEKSSMAATPAEGKPPVEGARRTSEDDARPRGTSSSSEGESFPSALPAPTLAVDEPLEQLTIFTGTWNMGEDEGPEAGYLRYWLDQGRIPGADDAKERGDLAPEGVRSNLQGMQPRDVKGGKRRKSQKEVVPPLSVPLPSERLFDLYAIGVQECMEMGILVKKMKAVIGPGYVVTRHRIGTRLRGLGYHGYIGLLLFVKTSLVERGICDFARLSKQSVALGRNLFVTRASNKGGVAISIPLTIPAWVLRPGGTNPDSVGQDSLFVDPVALLAQRNGCQVVQSREVFLKTSLTFSTCHLAADLHGVSRLDIRNRNAISLLQSLGMEIETSKKSAKERREGDPKGSKKRGSTDGSMDDDVGASKSDTNSWMKQTHESRDATIRRQRHALLFRQTSRQHQPSHQKPLAVPIAAEAEGTGPGAGAGGGGGVQPGGRQARPSSQDNTMAAAVALPAILAMQQRQSNADRAMRDIGSLTQQLQPSFDALEKVMHTPLSVDVDGLNSTRERARSHLMIPSKSHTPQPREGANAWARDSPNTSFKASEDDVFSPSFQSAESPEPIASPDRIRKKQSFSSSRNRPSITDLPRSMSARAPRRASAMVLPRSPGSPSFSSPSKHTPASVAPGSLLPLKVHDHDDGSRRRSGQRKSVGSSLKATAGHGYVFLLGDLNYRLDLTPDQALLAISRAANDPLGGEVPWHRLLVFDQLRREMMCGTVFPSFLEPNITFAPSYRRRKGTTPRLLSARGDYADIRALANGYTLTVKKRKSKNPLREFRTPSYTDRVLYRPPLLEPLAFRFSSRKSEFSGLSSPVLKRSMSEDSRRGRSTVEEDSGSTLENAMAARRSEVSLGSPSTIAAPSKPPTAPSLSLEEAVVADIQDEVFNDGLDSPGIEQEEEDIVLPVYPPVTCFSYGICDEVVGSDHTPVYACFVMNLAPVVSKGLRSVVERETETGAASMPIDIPGAAADIPKDTDILHPEVCTEDSLAQPSAGSAPVSTSVSSIDGRPRLFRERSLSYSGGGDHDAAISSALSTEPRRQHSASSTSKFRDDTAVTYLAEGARKIGEPSSEGDRLGLLEVKEGDSVFTSDTDSASGTDSEWDTDATPMSDDEDWSIESMVEGEPSVGGSSSLPTRRSTRGESVVSKGIGFTSCFENLQIKEMLGLLPPELGHWIEDYSILISTWPLRVQEALLSYFENYVLGTANVPPPQPWAPTPTIRAALDPGGSLQPPLLEFAIPLQPQVPRPPLAAEVSQDEEQAVRRCPFDDDATWSISAEPCMYPPPQ